MMNVIAGTPSFEKLIRVQNIDRHSLHLLRLAEQTSLDILIMPH
jgi:hypothetical protein